MHVNTELWVAARGFLGLDYGSPFGGFFCPASAAGNKIGWQPCRVPSISAPLPLLPRFIGVDRAIGH